MPVRFDEQWITETQLGMRVRLVKLTQFLPGHVVEIGVHQGRSALPMANAIYPHVLHAVDNWSGADLSPEAQARDNYMIFLDNVDAGTSGNVTIWEQDWRAWARDWRKPIRFVHIDAHHTARDVADTISALFPFMVPGGIIAGDDYGKPPVAEGVRMHFETCHVYEDMWWVHA